MRDAVTAELVQRASFYVEAAALLGASPAQVGAVRARIAAARNAAPSARPALATAAHAAASQLLTATQSQTPANPALDRSAMVEALSQTGGLEPHAEERGVVLVLRGLFVQGTARLVPTGRGRLAVVARVLENYAPLGVRVEALVGGAAAAAARLATSQAETLVNELVHAGVAAARLHPAGEARVPSGSRSDDRVELVLLVPSAP